MEQARLFIEQAEALGDTSGETAFEYFGDPCVKRASWFTQQRAIGCVLHQGMLESIGRMRRYALPVEQTGVPSRHVDVHAGSGGGNANYLWKLCRSGRAGSAACHGNRTKGLALLEGTWDDGARQPISADRQSRESGPKAEHRARLPIVRARQLVQRALVFLQAKRERTCHRQRHALPNPMRGQILKVRYHPAP